MTLSQHFLYYGDEIWGHCYRCKIACSIFYEEIPELFGSTRTGLCIEEGPGVRIPRSIDPKKFNPKKHIVSCTRCIGNVFLTKDDELYRKCSTCLKFINDSDMDACDVTQGSWFNTSYDLHILECKDTQHKWERFREQRDQKWQRNNYVQPTKPKTAFLIRKPSR